MRKREKEMIRERENKRKIVCHPKMRKKLLEREKEEKKGERERERKKLLERKKENMLSKNEIERQRDRRKERERNDAKREREKERREEYSRHIYTHTQNGTGSCPQTSQSSLRSQPPHTRYLLYHPLQPDCCSYFKGVSIEREREIKKAV